MRLKTLIIVVALLAAASAAVYVLNRPQAAPSADARVGQPLVDAGTVEKAAKLKLTDQGKTVLLTKQPSGSWQVSSYHDLPADFPKLSSLVGDLTAAKLEQFVSANPDRIARLEFKDTKIALLDSADKELWSVTLGKTAEAGGRFVRLGDEQKAYRANLNAWLDPEPRNWADSQLLALKSDDIARVELTFADAAPVVATRAKKEDSFAAENPPEGQKLKTDKIASLLSSVGNLRFSDTTELADPAATAAKQNTRTVKLTTFDNKTVTIALGRKPEEKITKPAPATPPAPSTNTDTTPSALSKDAPAATPPADSAKPAEPVTETIPAGPTYAFITHSDSAAPINALMQKRGYQVYEYTLTGLPQKRDELFEPAPPPPAATPAPAPAAAAPSSGAAPAPATTP